MIIKACGKEELDNCVQIAAKRNRLAESNCSYCPKEEADIRRDFAYIINNAACFMAGWFDAGVLAGIMAFFVNPENGWADCIGPFFADKFDKNAAKALFMFAQTHLEKVVRYNFYFNALNVNMHQFVEELYAQRQDNEYILRLNRSDYIPQKFSAKVIEYSDIFESELLQLHSKTFPEVYVSGADIVSSIEKKRRVFCVLNEHDIFAGYGVLYFHENNRCLTAEIFAVKEEMRGKGLGRALFCSVIEYGFAKCGAEKIQLVVDKWNTTAQRLYFSCGFQLVVENEVYYI